MTYAPVRKKRRWVGPVVFVVVLLLLITIAFLVAEKLVRDGASAVLSAPIKQAFGAQSDVAVEFGQGSVILQAMGGSIDSVSVDADNVTLGESTGRIQLVAGGVPLSTDGTIRTLSADWYVDAAGVTALMASSDSPAAVQLADDRILVTTETQIVGQTVPLVVTVVPSAAEGYLSLTVEALTVDGEAVDVEAAKAGSYGQAVAALVATRSVCVADKLPTSLAIDSASVVGDQLVLGFTGTNVALSGGGLTTKGSCDA
jgi:hypothetical protein